MLAGGRTDDSDGGDGGGDGPIELIFWSWTSNIETVVAAAPDSIIEAARADGAGELRIFGRIAVPMMMPGLVTIFLFQFVGIWNNFLLPFVMLTDDRLFPVTVGLYTLLNRGADQPAFYTLVITGSLLSIIPLIALFLYLQRFWRADLLSGAVKA